MLHVPGQSGVRAGAVEAKWGVGQGGRGEANVVVGVGGVAGEQA